MDIASFRAAQPAFADSSRFPNAAVQIWLDAATIQLDADVWGGLLDLATSLYVAHNLLVDASGAASALSRTASSGPVSGKSVGGASISYDVGATLLEGAGPWNLTTYGTRLLQLARGIGGVGTHILPFPANTIFPLEI